MTYYPVALDLEGRRCLVVGGGALATEKVEGLLRGRADVTVVGEGVTSRLDSLDHDRLIAVRRRQYHPTDLANIYLAYGASDDRALNAAVAQDARVAGVLVNAVDDIPHCDFYAMAIARRGDLQVAISTDGRSPALARWVREHLEESLPGELEELLSILSELRQELRSRGEARPYDQWKRAIGQALPLLRAGRTAAAYEAAHSMLASAEPSVIEPVGARA